MRTDIIRFLKDSSGYISGEMISKELHISRSAVWKAIEELRREGYRIAALPKRGYLLEASPDRLIAAELQSGLKAKIIGKTIHCFDSVESTMDVAFKLGGEGSAEGTIVCAETQTRGKGRMGRLWTSPEGTGIYFSVILRPALSTAEVPRLTLLAAVAVCEALRQTGCDARIKWPNDILINGKKVCGILTELNGDIDRVRFVVVGVGINVNTPVKVLPPNATSLKQESGKKMNRLECFREVLSFMDEYYQEMLVQGFDKAIQRWKELSVTLGRRVRMIDHGVSIEGEAVDLDEYGGLMIKTPNGSLIRRMSGDVSHV